MKKVEKLFEKQGNKIDLIYIKQSKHIMKAQFDEAGGGF